MPSSQANGFSILSFFTAVKKQRKESKKNRIRIKVRNRILITIQTTTETQAPVPAVIRTTEAATSQTVVKSLPERRKTAQHPGNASGSKDNSKNNSKTQSGLADGTYTPDQFSWSGGSGRLAYIACDKITVKKGKAYATIRFSSSSYDKVQAGGGIYANTGGAESTFTIPVTLNANNTISARTVAMSAPHWIDYTIYPYLAEAGKGNGGVTKTAKQKTQGKSTKDKGKDKDGKEVVSEIIGLGEAEEIPMKYAEYCRFTAIQTVSSCCRST